MIASSSSSYRRCLKRLQLLKEGVPACPRLAILAGPRRYTGEVKEGRAHGVYTIILGG